MHAAHICCTCNTGNPDETGSHCPHHASCSEECPITKVCDIPCHTCAATKIWPCLSSTKTDLGTVDSDCPWTLFHNALPHTSPVNCHSNHCVIYSKKGGCCMFALDLRTAPTGRPVNKSSLFAAHIYFGSCITLAHVIWVSKSKHYVDKFQCKL